MNDTPSSFQHACALLGRTLVALIFLRSAVVKIVGYTGTVTVMAAKGLPYPEYLLVAAIAIELIGGTALAFGYKARWAAAALILFLIPATLLFHDYWAAEPQHALNQSHHFFKNVAILGALVFVLGVGAGGASVDNRRRY